MVRAVCVYSSSSDAVAPHYMEAAAALGALLAREKLTLVYGGKPVVFLNTSGFFAPLLAMFERLYEEQFTKHAYRDHYHVADSPDGVLTHFNGYTPPEKVHKWFG